MKRVSFKTIGCRLNQAETAVMAASFRDAGWQVVDFGERCDACVIHTCTITAKAERDCLRIARSLKRAQNDTTVVLAGCAVEVAGESLGQKCGADIVAGQKTKFLLPYLLEEKTEKSETAPVPGIPVLDTTRALIKVQDGCDFRCSYCIVPSARGNPSSRPFQKIVDEIRALGDNGYKEVVLTGANLGCYRDGKTGIVEILQRIEDISGIARIRLSSIEVSTVERQIIDYMASSKKLCRSIHIPMQSGDNDILRAMGRRYTAEQYSELAAYAMSKIPLLGIGTDIIVGFPGETEKAYENTLKIVENIPFGNLHIFTYSKRSGTKAATMPCQIDEKTKKIRSRRLIELGKTKKMDFARKFIGKEVSILIETVKDNIGAGWTSEYVYAKIPVLRPKTNQIIKFIPTSFAHNALV